MKEVVSNCEKEFVLNSVWNKKRLDGRGFNDFRNLLLNFGSDYGCCYATLGETKVLAQVSCSLNEPRPLRPTEGLLFINVEISETVCPSYDTGHQPHLATHANRQLEKCIKESRCVDLESLCLVAGEQVFDIRVDVTVLNYDGNLLTCCSVATLAALGHFRLPAVTIENSEVIIHSTKEKAPIPLSLHHYPILVSFAVFCEGEVALLDPTELEEKVSEGELVIGMNNYRELCGLHFSGRALGNKDLILSCSSQAALTAAETVKRLKLILEEDQKMRDVNRGMSNGLIECIHLDRVLSASKDRQALRLKPEQLQAVLDHAQNRADSGDGDEGMLKRWEENGDEDGEYPNGYENENVSINEGSMNDEVKQFITPDYMGGIEVAAMETSDFCKEWIPKGGKSTWDIADNNQDSPINVNEDDDDDDDVNYVKTITDEDRIIDKIELSGDSEEEEVVVLKTSDT